MTTLSESINWTNQADPSSREPCCAKGDPCLEHNEDTQRCGNCPEIYVPKNPNEDPGYCPECIELICKEEEVKCDECFSTTAEHKSYCSALNEHKDCKTCGTTVDCEDYYWTDGICQDCLGDYIEID